MVLILDIDEGVVHAFIAAAFSLAYTCLCFYSVIMGFSPSPLYKHTKSFLLSPGEQPSVHPDLFVEVYSEYYDAIAQKRSTDDVKHVKGQSIKHTVHFGVVS